MTYLIRLARRATGLSLGNLLQPNVRCWDDRYDPFENEVIRHDTSSHKRAEAHTTNTREDVSIPQNNHQRADTYISNAREDVSIPQHNHQMISDANKTKTKSVSENTKCDEEKPLRTVERLTVTKVVSTADTHLTKQHPSLKKLNKTTRRDVTGTANSTASKIKTALLRQQPVTTTHQRTENNGLEVCKGDCSQLFRRLADKAVTSTQVTTKARSAMQQVTSRRATTKVLEVLSPGIQRIEPSNKASLASTVPHRRKAPAAQTEVAPRLIIGSLKVDVVPVANIQKHRESTLSSTRQQKKNSKRDSSQQAVKMGFGLGQM